ncbi:hypothetical protein RN001_001006 [Aquatica leii]|uniref:DUF3730 domain-containing protein n=1 Tax=Aquatica leii TaxID=1421715 RepID=A0AAN7QA29_9COLE|nr:hypothetical protein RN001_001006 [Aquatica leii]
MFTFTVRKKEVMFTSPVISVTLKIFLIILNMKRLKEKQYSGIYVTTTISKIVERITNKENNEQELKYLVDKCIYSEDAVTSLAASSALILLVNAKVLQISSLLSQLLASLSFIKSHVGILTVICELLKIDLKLKIKSKEICKCEYNLKVPQHPLISILNQHPDAWYNIFNKLKSFYEDEEVSFYANELMYAFYMYVICNPSLSTNPNLQTKLWNYVINVNDQQSLDVVLHTIMWFPLSAKNIVNASCFFIDLTHTQRFCSNEEFSEIVILWLTSITYELIKFDEDPQPILNCLYNAIETKRDCLEKSTSIILIMLSNSICLSSSIYLTNLLRLCRILLSSNYSSEFALLSLKASLLHWKAFKCFLTEHSVNLASEVMQTIDTTMTYRNISKNIYSNKLFKILSCTNEYIHWITEITILGESLNTSNMIQHLEKIDSVPIYILSDFINCLTSILLRDDCSPEVTIKVVEMLSKVVEVYKGLSTQILILLMYKLSHSQEPFINFALLNAVPKMAVLEENLPLVLNILKLTREGLVGMKSFSLTLYYNLWETSNKCYSYLQSILADSNISDQSQTVKMEFYTTKAHVAKQLCMKSPERYGSELVGHLSEILNCCKKNWGTVATSFALEGIIFLCKSGIISIGSTWKALEPYFENETRVPIIKKICDFMTEINSFDPSEYSDELLSAIVTKLFVYVTSESAEVVSAAYNALGSFSLDEVMTELNLVIDGKFKTNSKPGNCWITLLENTETSNLNYVGDFLIKYVSVEIANYRKGTYIVPEGCKEPTTYNYLPERSIVRALGNYLKRNIQVWHDSSKYVYLQCLRVLSQEYSKILPPMDWCFLQELIHDSEARLYCIAIACHQVQLSGTARRLIENYVEAIVEVTNKDEDIVAVYQQLKYLCNSIQPMTLRPFIEKSLNYAIKTHEAEVQTKGKSLLQILVVHVRQILTDETLQEANKMALAQVLVNVTWHIGIDTVVFLEILKCVIKLPKRFIDELSSPKLWKTPSVANLKLSVKVRCAVAVDTNSLSWMNEFIDETSFMAVEQPFVLLNIANLIKSYRNSECASTWLLEYLNHIQSTIANENMSNYNLQFLCDVFIISMIILSGYNVFLESTDELVRLSEYHLLMFSQSITKLMKIQYWNSNIGHIAEWLFHMSSYPETPMHYRKTFYQTLAAIRNENSLEITSTWMKYVANTLPSSQ